MTLLDRNGLMVPLERPPPQGEEKSPMLRSREGMLSRSVTPKDQSADWGYHHTGLDYRSVREAVRASYGAERYRMTARQ